MASSKSELFRSLSVSIDPFEYFTDSSNTINLKSDVTLIVGEKKFYCHRLLLSLISPVFSRMFDGEFREHHAHEIKLEGKTSESILELLKYIYPQFHGNVTKDNVDDLLLLADEYMIDHLKTPCKNILLRQLEQFHFVALPVQHRLEQPSTKTKHFHASDSALNASPHHEDDLSRQQRHGLFRPRRPTSVSRHTPSKPANHSKSDDKNNSSTSNPRYILFLDHKEIPKFYDQQNNLVPFTTSDAELWFRRLRILYQIDKGRNYGDLADLIIAVLQFIPGSLLSSLAHVTMETYRIDEIMLNDMARARMYMLEEWSTDGDAYRVVHLTDSYKLTSPSVLAIAAQEQGQLETIESLTIDTQNTSSSTLTSQTNIETSTISVDADFDDSD